MLDQFFIVVSGITPAVVLFIVPMLLYCKDEKKLTVYFLSLGISFGLVILLKYLFNLPRPENAMVQAHTPRFPSSHAALSFFLPGFFRGLKYRLPLLLFAVLVSYSRLYLNVHKPVDLVIGGLIGFFVPTLVLWKEEKLKKLF